MLRYHKKEQMLTLNRGETAKFNVVLPIRDQNGYIMYSDKANTYWYDPVKEIIYDTNYKKTKISLSTLKKQVYPFNDGDIVRFSVFDSGDCEKVKIQKEFQAKSGDTRVRVFLTSDDTTIDDYINTHVDYWYEIELKRDDEIITIVGYDENKAKIFRLYPEGGIKSND